MVGAVAQRVPLSGALGMSIIGGVGMFSTAIFQPIIGAWIDKSRAVKEAAGLTGNELELAAGQDTLAKIVPYIFLLAKKDKSQNICHTGGCTLVSGE